MRILKILLAVILVILIYNITVSIFTANSLSDTPASSSTPLPTATMPSTSSDDISQIDSEAIALKNDIKKEDKLFKLIPADTLSLDANGVPWGPGRHMNDINQPTAVVTLMEKYKELGGIFLMEGMTIYLTFDLGYEAGYTLSILDTLKASGVQATFFLTAGYAQDHKEITQRIIDDGHTIGNHSTTHPDMTKISIEDAKSEILGMHEIMEREYNYTPYLFRFPFGTFSQQTLGIMAENQYYSVFWSFAYNDWDTNIQPTYDAALAATEKAAHPGAIYLLHPLKTNSDILAQLIKSLQSQGYALAAF